MPTPAGQRIPPVRKPEPTPRLKEDGRVDAALQQLEVQAANFGTRFIQDAGVRELYAREIKKMSEQVLEGIRKGEITPKQGAEFANQMRNVILEESRKLDSELGRAFAEKWKSVTPSMEDMIARKSLELFGREASTLSAAEANRVYLAIAESAGRPNPTFMKAVPYLKTAGRTAVVLTTAVSVYNVATAQDKVETARREGLGIAGGFVGGAAGGAVAGLLCGPGSPICSGIGIFVGGVAGALGVDLADRVVNPRPGDGADTHQVPTPMPAPPPTPPTPVRK